RAEVPVRGHDEQRPRPRDAATERPPGLGEAVPLERVHRAAVADEQCRHAGVVHAFRPSRSRRAGSLRGRGKSTRAGHPAAVGGDFDTGALYAAGQSGTGPATPACSAVEMDDAEMEVMSRDALLAAMNELLEA